MGLVSTTRIQQLTWIPMFVSITSDLRVRKFYEAEALRGEWSAGAPARLDAASGEGKLSGIP